jgi:hypothetical protein
MLKKVPNYNFRDRTGRTMVSAALNEAQELLWQPSDSFRVLTWLLENGLDPYFDVVDGLTPIDEVLSGNERLTDIYDHKFVVPKPR